MTRRCLSIFKTRLGFVSLPIGWKKMAIFQNFSANHTRNLSNQKAREVTTWVTYPKINFLISDIWSIIFMLPIKRLCLLSYHKHNQLKLNTRRSTSMNRP